MSDKSGSAIRSGLAALTSVALLLGGNSRAFAADDVAVEALIQRGIELRRSSADEEALDVFLEAEKRDPTSVRVLLHVVTAAQAAGKWLMADSYMQKVSARSQDPYYQRHSDAIDTVRRSIAVHIGTFRVDGAPDGATVSLDGELVGTLPMSEPATVQSGTYLMDVHRSGFFRVRRTVVIAGGVLTREPVVLKRAMDRSAALGGSAEAPGVTDDFGLEGEEPAWWKAPAVGYGLLGLGVASGVVSGIAFMARERRVEEWNDDARCIPSDSTATREANCGSLRDGAEQAETIGVVSGLAGLILTAGGLAHVLVLDSDGPRRGPEKTSGLELTRCSAGMLSLACQGSF